MGNKRTCFSHLSNNHLKTLEKPLSFRLEEGHFFFLNHRNYMKGYSLHTVSQAFADTYDPGNEHKLTPGLLAFRSNHRPSLATKAGKKCVRLR